MAEYKGYHTEDEGGSARYSRRIPDMNLDQASLQDDRQTTGQIPIQSSGQFPRQSSGQFPRQDNRQSSGQFSRQSSGQFSRQGASQFSRSGQIPRQSSGQDFRLTAAQHERMDERNRTNPQGQPAFRNDFSRSRSVKGGQSSVKANAAKDDFSSSKARLGNEKASRKSINYIGYGTDGIRKKRSPVRSIIVGAAAIVLLVLLVFGGYKLGQSFGLFGGKETPVEVKEVTVFIPEGATTKEIAKELKKNKVIANENEFIKAVQEKGVESQLLPGQYHLRTGMKDADVVKALLDGPNPFVGGNKLTLPEGLTLEATAKRVEAACGIKAQDFIAEARNARKYVADYPFLEAVFAHTPEGYNSLEGFLYPKTYWIPESADAEYVVRILLDQFQKETRTLDMTYAESRNLDIFDVVIIASMIEKETATPSEKELVSSVIYNRLRNGWKLQICATVVYAMGEDNYDGRPLLISDTEIDSPYNTYMYNGMPVGPICSPHISSIIAAAHPAITDYFYYVLTSKEGTHTFCKDAEEFEAANQIYRDLFNVPN